MKDIGVFHKLDGLGRTPRDGQIEVLAWLNSNKDVGNYFAIQAPTGLGKSSIFRTIQIAYPGCHIITPDNVLVSQYRETYPDLNYFIGSDHYAHHHGCDPSNGYHHLECPYRNARSLVAAGVGSITNTFSMYYFNRFDRSSPPLSRKFVLVDEAHKVLDSLRDMASVAFHSEKFVFTPDDVVNDFAFVRWLKHQESFLTPQAIFGNKAAAMLKSVLKVKEFYLNEPEKFAVSYEITPTGPTIRVDCITVPSWVIKTLFKGCDKVILMSGTLFKPDIEEFLGEHAGYLFLDVPSPFPLEHRPIYYRPADIPINKDTPGEMLAFEIERTLDWVYEAHGTGNTIIHVPYAWQAKLQDNFTRYNPLFHNSKSKADVLAKFKEEGGILVGSGMSEGISLDYDLARINIIPKLLQPNLGAPVVRKRRAIPGGEQDYDLTTLKTLMQQVGRTTRAIDDKSVTVVTDPGFSRFIARTRKFIPDWFYNSIIWSSK